MHCTTRRQALDGTNLRENINELLGLLDGYNMQVII
jgi:hypothetical protein